jgi:hypothetical protein
MRLCISTLSVLFVEVQNKTKKVKSRNLFSYSQATNLMQKSRSLYAVVCVRVRRDLSNGVNFLVELRLHVASRTCDVF